MFSHCKNTTNKILSSIGFGFHWILNNKKTIAIFALMMTADAANAAINRPIIFETECGNFELKRVDELKNLLNSVGRPIRFGAAFDDSEGEKECFSTKGGNVLCEPPADYSKKDFLKITAGFPDICAAFNELSASGKIKNPERFFSKDRSKKPSKVASIEIPASGHFRKNAAT
jgi:hypothetical protein